MRQPHPTESAVQLGSASVSVSGLWICILHTVQAVVVVFSSSLSLISLERQLFAFYESIFHVTHQHSDGEPTTLLRMHCVAIIIIIITIVMCMLSVAVVAIVAQPIYGLLIK